MTEILEFLIRYCSFLWADGWYRITDGIEVDVNGRNAHLLVESKALHLRFLRDRGELTLDLRASWADQKAPWYSIDLFQRLLTGENQGVYSLNENYARFLQEHLLELEALVTREAFPKTEASLKKLMKIRTKELFG